ncbi:hypothetical protein HK105_204191 [Polyrhizophydium stewartii]|uniref:Uncharacterized protein n=1 Tax=Polyrhizophydium stewartii TaxID=2732419 RepID=A0ABR4N995_9FUNG
MPLSIINASDSFEISYSLSYTIATIALAACVVCTILIAACKSSKWTWVPENYSNIASFVVQLVFSFFLFAKTSADLVYNKPAFRFSSVAAVNLLLTQIMNNMIIFTALHNSYELWRVVIRKGLPLTKEEARRSTVIFVTIAVAFALLNSLCADFVIASSGLSFDTKYTGVWAYFDTAISAIRSLLAVFALVYNIAVTAIVARMLMKKRSDQKSATSDAGQQALQGSAAATQPQQQLHLEPRPPMSPKDQPRLSKIDGEAIQMQQLSATRSRGFPRSSSAVGPAPPPSFFADVAGAVNSSGRTTTPGPSSPAAGSVSNADASYSNDVVPDELSPLVINLILRAVATTASLIFCYVLTIFASISYVARIGLPAFMPNLSFLFNVCAPLFVSLCYIGLDGRFKKAWKGELTDQEIVIRAALMRRNERAQNRRAQDFDGQLERDFQMAVLGIDQRDVNDTLLRRRDSNASEISLESTDSFLERQAALNQAAIEQGMLGNASDTAMPAVPPNAHIAGM